MVFYRTLLLCAALITMTMVEIMYFEGCGVG